jgi:hypothetical protein
MPVTATSSAESQRAVGDQWPIDVFVTDPDGWGVSVAPVVTVTRPDGTTDTPTVQAVRGCYRALYPVADAGRHVASAAVAGYGQADFVLTAVAPTTAGAMPAVADVNAYLGANSWSDEEIADALATETAAQRTLCAVPAHYPDDLRGALLRRVARNLGMRRVPLAQPVGDAEAGSSVIPPYDPEINRLERPHKRFLVA